MGRGTHESILPSNQEALTVLCVRLLVLASYPNSAAATRFRVSAYFSAMRGEGIEPDFRPFMTDTDLSRLYSEGQRLSKALGLLSASLRRVVLAARDGNYDAVFVQREAMLIGRPWLELLLASARSIPLIFDFDDAIWIDTHHTSRNPRAASLLKCPRKTEALVRVASHVIAGSSYLGDYARRLGASVTVLPTVVSRESWTPLPSRLDGEWLAPDGVPTIGWVGSHSTARQLEIVLPALQALAARGHRFRVRIVGASREFRVPGVEVVNMPWKQERELADFQSADIAVVPMLDDAWSRGKCGFKELQYMAVGVPVVASGIGGGSAFLEHGANALLARDAQSFAEQIERLLVDQGLRARIGRAGRHLVESRLCTELQAPVVTRIVRGVGVKRQ